MQGIIITIILKIDNEEYSDTSEKARLRSLLGWCDKQSCPPAGHSRITMKQRGANNYQIVIKKFNSRI